MAPPPAFEDPRSAPGPSADQMVARLRAAGCVFAEEEAALLLGTAPDGPTLATWIDRRVAGEPLEHLLGFVEFAGRRVAVTPGVFVPRRRTEVLARQALAALAGDRPVVLELCCGCGAVAAVVAAARPDVDLLAADLDPAAVACARINLPGAQVLVSDLFAAVPATYAGRIEVIVANAPYVPTDAIALMPPEARDHEPRLALDGGPDGLDLHRRIAAEADRWLSPAGRLLIETSLDQADETAGALTAAGFAVRIVHDEDLYGTVAVAVRSTGSE